MSIEGRGITPILAHGCLGQLYLSQGDLEHAVRVLEQGLALCRATGDRNWLQIIVAGLGSAYALQGRLAEGHALLEEGIGESIRTGELRGNAARLAQLSEVCRLSGHGDDALQHACHALDLARQQKARGDEAQALHQLGVVHAHADSPDVAQADTHYQQALALAEELGMHPLVAHCHHGLGRLYAQSDRAEHGRTALTTAIDLYRAMQMIVRQAMCARDEGRPLAAGLRRQAANPRKRLGSRALVVSVTEKARRDLVRCKTERRTQVNH